MPYHNTTQSSCVEHHNGRSSSSEIDISFQKIAKILYYYGTTCGFGNMSVSDDIDD